MQNNIFSGLFVGQNLVVLKQVDSTNTYLKDLVSNSKPVAEGTVIMAEDQFAGRGQQQNTWHSQAGKNLTFSLLLRPTFLGVQQQFDLNRVISIAVINALEQVTGEQFAVKWPNDIYHGDKKLGGILIENIISGSHIKHSVVGIGLNINQDVFPADAPNPTSLKQILHTDYDLQMLLSQICSYIEAWYLKLKAGKLAELREAYLQKLYWYGQERNYADAQGNFTATLAGVRDEGLLVLQTHAGERLYNFKEVQFLNKQS